MKKTMDEIVKNTTMKDVSAMQIDADGFIELYNENKAILLDIRYPFETKLWSLKFALEIPYNELPDRLEEIDKEKIIVCACPGHFRSNMAREYLLYKGFKAKALMNGLNKLVERLGGGKAKDIKF